MEVKNMLVIGGGIAGSTCAIELLRLSPSSKVTLVSPSSTLRAIKAIENITPLLGIVHVEDRPSDDFAAEHGVHFVCDEVVDVDPVRSQAKLASGGILPFTRCCIATGASPALEGRATPRYFGIRDTEVWTEGGLSVGNLRDRLVHAKRVLIVGNGGLAMELVHCLVSTQDCQVVWAVRNSYVGNTFLDASASAFFLQNVGTETVVSRSETTVKVDKPMRDAAEKTYGMGEAVGPEWLKMLARARVTDQDGTTTMRQPSLDIQYGCELDDVCESGEHGALYPVSATLTNGRRVECDFVVSATGVRPNTALLSSDFKRGPDEGLCVDDMMRVVRSGCSVDMGNYQNNIFAAGDCCCLERDADHWFQIRLWRQAKDMGLYAAKCMTDSLDELSCGGAFDLFVHATRFFGFKVALLGRFNGQGLGKSVQDLVSTHALDVGFSGSGVENGGGNTTPECHHESIHIEQATSGSINVLIRTTPGVEYVKVILVGGRVRGAMLVGDTGLEETFENLILCGIDVSHLGDDLLSHNVDIEGLFD